MVDQLDMLIAGGPPRLDFSPIANLGNDYAKGVQNGAQVSLLKALQNGVPTDANGNPDYGALANLAAKGGDLKSAASFATLGNQLKTRAAIPQYLSSVFGGGTGAAPASAPLTGDYFSKLRTAESGGNPNAANPNSSAVGPYQFTQGTWADLMQRHPELGLTPQGVTDPAQQEKAVQAFTSDNFDYLSGNGIQPTDQNLRLAHFAGPEGALHFLQGAQANPNAPAASLFGPAAVKANQSLFFGKDGRPVSAGEFYTNLTGKFATGPQDQQQPANAGGMAGMDPMRLFQAGVMLSSIPGGEETGKALIQFASTLQGQQKPTFGQIGESATGQKTYGFINPGTQQVTPINAGGGANGSGVIPTDANGNALSGDALLKAIPSDVRPIVEKLVNYQVDPRTLSLRNGYRDRLITLAAAYDPTYDQAQYPSRAAAIKEFNTGGANSPAGQITAGNTAIQHLGELWDLSGKLGGVNNASVFTGPLNRLNIGVEGAKNNPDLVQYTGTLDRFVEEATKFYRGVGGNEADIQRAVDAVTAAQSPQARKAAIQQQIKLMADKVQALQSRWKTALGPTGWMRATGEAGGDFPIIQKETQGVLDKVFNRQPAGPQGAPGTTVANAPAKVTSNAEANQEIARARAAVAQGADRNAVLQMLQQKGVPTAGLTF